MKDRIVAFAKRIGPIVGYPIFYLFCLVIFLVWTFPMDKVRDRVVLMIATNAHTDVQIDDLDSSFLTGVKASGVRVLFPSIEPGKPASVLAFDVVRARISLLSFIFGTTSVTFDAEGLEGTISGSYSDSSKMRSLDAQLEGIDVARAEPIAAMLGVPLDGKISGTLKFDIPEGKIARTNGTIALEGKDMAAGTRKEKELTIKTPMGPFTLPRVTIGTVNLTGEAKDGVLSMTKIAASGGDVDLAGNGKIQLRDPVPDSRLDVNLKVKLSDAYRNKNDKTKLLFGAPGAKDKPMIEMSDPRIGRAKGADGAYGVHLGGSLGKPVPEPGSPTVGVPR
jgi:type II secretion system protein N